MARAHSEGTDISGTGPKLLQKRRTQPLVQTTRNGRKD